MRNLLALSMMLGLALPACTTTTYDDGWGDDEFSNAKADGLGDLAKFIAFDEIATGEVDEESVRLYKISLFRGDQVSMDMDVTAGNLSPHFTLFEGTTSTISSQNFNVNGGHLDKDYLIEDSGLYLIAVRAFQHQGAGEYEFKITCNDGPCAGNFPVEPVDFEDADTCINEAFECSIAALPAFNGAVGPVRSRQIFEECLASSSIGATSCADACNDDFADAIDAFITPSSMCDAVINSLPFYADQSAECIEQLDICMESCTELAEFHDDSNQGDDDGLWGFGFSMCWDLGFNGTCDSYARELEQCGGSLALGSDDECHELCESTDGVWMDDLDSICSDAC